MNRPLFLSLACLFLLSSAILGGEGEWSRFRGPNGSGVSSATTVPVQWTERDYNWKIRLPGVGRSSPVVWRDRIFVTCGDTKTARRSVLCLDASDGSRRWQRNFPSRSYRQHGANSYATATPAVDAHGVVVTWTTPEEVTLLALDLDGGDLWRRNLGPFVGERGSGTSPIIVGDLVILANDQENPNLLPENLNKPDPTRPVGESFLIALDRKTGKTRWRVDRRTGLAAYSTPSVYLGANGQSELIFTSTSHGVTSVDPGSGKTNWEIPDLLPERCVASPVSAPGLVIVGFGRGMRGSDFYAVRSSGRDKNVKRRLAYRLTKSLPLVPTPIVHGERLFLWTDDGVATCVNVATGELIWRERVGGSYLGSPVCVNARLYCVAKNGEVVVLAAADKFEILSRVPLGEPSYATPAVAGGIMYLRSDAHLFSLGGHTAAAK